MIGCTGRKPLHPKIPCPREAEWEVDFGTGTVDQFCDYHKQNVDEFHSAYATVIPLRPAEPPTLPMKG